MAPIRVCIVGGGAIGAFYGARLSVAGCITHIVCRSNYTQVRANNGYDIESSALGDHHYSPHGIHPSCLHARQALGSDAAFDYVLICTKVKNMNKQLPIFPVVKPGKSVIVLAQNGIGIEENVRQDFPENPILSSILYIGATQPTSTSVLHSGLGRFMLGVYQGPKGDSIPPFVKYAQDRAKEFVHILKLGHVEAHYVDDIQFVRWHKTGWNASFGPISILSGCIFTSTILNTPELKQLTIETMKEIWTMGLRFLNAESFPRNLPVPLYSVEGYLLATQNLGHYHPSVTVDFLAHRETEIESLLEAPLKAFESLPPQQDGWQPVRCRTMCALIKALEAGKSSNNASKEKSKA